MDGKRELWVDVLSTRVFNLGKALVVGQGYKYLNNLVCVGKVDNACIGTLKAPLHGTIRPHGACRFPCIWANRSV